MDTKETLELQKKANEQAEKKRKLEAKKEAEAFKRVSGTEDGRYIFRYFLRQCGFHAASVNVDTKTGQILTENTVYNEARRNIYLGLRKMIPPKNLVKIEFNLEAATDEDDDELDL